MLNISENLKNILRNDRFPLTDTITPKDLEIIFDGMDPIYADQIVDDTFELTESIISDNDIRFGTCRASQIKFKLANVPEELKGREFTIDQLIGDTHVIPLGKFKVESAKLEDDLIFKEVIAYDKLKDTDVDVSAWYNSLTFPMTLKAFRTSLLIHLGIDEIDQTLPNDDMEVTKTIEPTQISGRTVLEATVELNGAFGHINRQGKFVRIVLQPSYGLYPSETLYPSEALYPVSETDTSYVQEDIVADTVSKAMYQSVRFEEYSVKEIDKLQIRAEENDIGAIVGAGTNAYVIEGNFLVFGKTASELEQIAINVFGNVAKRPYRPYTAQSIGLPYIEVGDALQFATDDTVTGYVLQRTLTGIQALRDEYEAPGSEEREQNFGVNKEIIQLQGKTAILKRNVEEVSATVSDLEEDLTGEISVLAGQVVLKVDANGNIAVVELDADPSEGTSIKLKADNIELEGYVSINGYTKILPNGSLEVTNAKISGTLTSPVINGGEITGASIVSTGIYGTTTINEGSITADALTAGGVVAEAILATATLQVGTDITLYAQTGNIECMYINGWTPVTAGNIASQRVGSATYADNSGYANSADTAYNASYLGYRVYVSGNGNLRPLNDLGGSCGTDGASGGARWTSVWALNGTIQTSDERKKTNIKPLSDDDRFIRFAKLIAPYTYQMTEGTSGRYHVGFIAQRIEEAMAECEISDMEFAGLIKNPIYAEKLKDEDGNELEDFDTNSDIIDYSYSLRYDEFIPLLFLWMRSQEVNE